MIGIPSKLTNTQPPNVGDWLHNLYGMLPPNATIANAESNSSRIALQVIANMRFIQDTVPDINFAIANGHNSVYLTTYKNCNLQHLTHYYHGLGYSVEFPGAIYEFFRWQRYPRNQTRIAIFWNLPFNPDVHPVTSTQTANYTMTQNNEMVWADTSLSAFTVSLPLTPLDGWVETINNQSANNPLTISGNGNNINGSPSNITLTLAGSYQTLIFTTGFGWATFPTP